jgi:hypothetical protein
MTLDQQVLVGLVVALVAGGLVRQIIKEVQAHQAKEMMVELALIHRAQVVVVAVHPQSV